MAMALLGLGPHPSGGEPSFAEMPETYREGLFMQVASAAFWPPYGIVRVIAYAGAVVDESADLEAVAPAAVMVACLRPPGRCSLTRPVVREFSVHPGGAGVLEANSEFGELTIRWFPTDNSVAYELRRRMSLLPALTENWEKWACIGGDVALTVVPERPLSGIWRSTYDGSFGDGPLLNPFQDPLARRSQSFTAIGAVGSTSIVWAEQPPNWKGPNPPC